ncbi:MAG: DsbA family protein [Micrococcales bacterium]|nr:DsbA family protein [Micrococcales bacterium]
MAGNDRPTKTQRREEARRKAAALRDKQEREARRNKIVGIGLLVVAVLVIGYGIFALVKRQVDIRANEEKYATAALPSVAPDLAAVDAPGGADPDLGGIPVSQQGVGVAVEGGVRVDVYLDFMCPFCGIFEQLQSDEAKALVDPQTGQADVTIVYHPVAIMGRASLGTNYSARAANAVAVVADQDPEHFIAFLVALMDEKTQPEEGTRGLTDEKIAQVAQGVGVPTAVTDRFTATADFEGETLRTFVPWVAAVTATIPFNEDGQQSTPTILINGERWSDWVARDPSGDYIIGEPLSQAVEAARAAAASEPAGGEG